MTFRRLFSADGIHDYFWKARPVRDGRRVLMGSHGVRDKVAIVGMGCTKFAELWEKGLDDLIVDASTEAFASAGVSKEDVDAYWFGTAQSGMSGITLARPLQLQNKPVTRVENYCTTGSEALRGAVYAVASGAYDVAMAVGAEKVKDSGFQGLERDEPTGRRHGPDADRGRDVLHGRTGLRPEVRRRRGDHGRRPGVHRGEEPLQRGPQPAGAVPARDHQGGRSRPRHASPAASVSSTVPGWPTARRRPSWCGPRTRRDYTDKPLYIKALSFAAGSGSGLIDPGYDYTHFPECEAAAADAYAQAGITDPRRQLAMAEVHDCFTPTELVLMEDLGFAPRGTAWKEVLAGAFGLDGDLPVNPDGGLKSFGHPVGASGLRMFFECWLQMRHEAPPERQIATTDRGLALTHNLGGYPGEMVSFVSVVGSRLG